MQNIILNERLTFSLESLDKKVRLIVFDADKELACRKETPKNLQKFLTVNEATLFKGRLQLNKYRDDIEVVIKGQPIAIIPLKTFGRALGEIQV